MNKNTPFIKSFCKPVIFGLYFVFFFSQLNYISKHYSSRVAGSGSYKNAKKYIVQSDQKQNGPEFQIKLNKRYYPKDLFEVPENQILELPVLIIQVTEEAEIEPSILKSPPLPTFQRGPPFIS